MFGLVSAFNKVEENYSDWFIQRVDQEAAAQIKNADRNFAQSLLGYVLNSLLAAWNLLPLLSPKLALSDEKKKLLCLSFTFQGYSKYCNQSATLPLALDFAEFLKQLQTLGEMLHLDAFWSEWRECLPDIAYLMQIPQHQIGENTRLAKRSVFKIPEHRLDLPLRPLLSFGTIAAQITDPIDLVTKPEGSYLQKLLQALGIDRTLVYHRLRNCTGLLTNQIHNAVLHFAEKLDWHPLLFFPQGVIYLAPPHHEIPDCTKLQEFLWGQVSNQLAEKMLKGEVGFKRDGKGLKAAPQTLELFSPAQLIRHLPNVIKACIKNEADPATPKRLEKLGLGPSEEAFLADGADLRSDRVAEFILFLQRQFFKDDLIFITWILEKLGIQSAITPEQTQIHSGGVNWGWYYAAAYFIASNPTLTLEDISAKLQGLADQLALCAEETALLAAGKNSTRNVFYNYLSQYLEIQGWDAPEPSFQQELEGYLNAKQVGRQPICSLSSGEFASEDQMDSVVLFKPQQYSNKNPLGGRQLKRGISKIWALEMLLRQAYWTVPASKLEEQQPVFLYIFPAYAHSPQVTRAIRVLVNQLKRVNLWEVRRFWRDHGMDIQALRFYPWLKVPPDPKEKDDQDLPFLAITYTTTKGKTTTEAWVEPAFLALALPLLLGVKVVATASAVPPYSGDNAFQEVVSLDEPAGFWNVLGLPTSVSLEERFNEQKHRLEYMLNRLLIAYSIHLDCKSSPLDPHWQAFPSTVRELATTPLAIFSLARSYLKNCSDAEVQRYWQFAHLWSAGDTFMEQQLELTQRLVQEYRTFYKVHVADSTYAIVLPLSKVLEDILSTPSDIPIETLILQTLGQLHDALRRQKPYYRPLIMDESLSIDIRADNEFRAIHQFVTTCIRDLFLGQYKGDRALLQAHRQRIKSGAEAAYRLLAMQEPKPKDNQPPSEGAKV
jgi:CRISPR-associated protein Csc3